MTKAIPRHAPMTQFEVHDDCLHIGGIPLTRLVHRVGATPFYAYDRHAITERVAHLRRYLPAEVHLSYAMKANPMPAVVQHLARLVDRIDVASAGELRGALDTPIAPDRISFAGPGKGDAEIRCAIASGCVINLESEHEMERVTEIGKQLGIRPTVALRVNPDFELKLSGMKMGGGPKQFGVDAERVPTLLEKIALADVDFEGFHIFAGSQNLNAGAIQQVHEQTLALAIALKKRVAGPLRTLNMGGGFGVPYFPGDEPLDLPAVGQNLNRLLKAAKNDLQQTRIVIELGRYVVAEAGVYVCRIIERKESRGQVFLVTDGGLHHHLAATGNFGQVIRKNYPVIIGNRVQGREREVVNVVGPLCTPLDVLAEKLDMAKAEVGDLVVVLQSGAYGLTASPTGFLGHPLPREVLI
jgi:diaminopimelate decarboxylase